MCGEQPPISFCYIGFVFLLESASIFATTISFFCWNHGSFSATIIFGFLVETANFFATIGFVFCWSHHTFFLLQTCGFCARTRIFCYNRCRFLLQLAIFFAMFNSRRSCTRHGDDDDFAGSVVDFCYKWRMLLLRPFMASYDPRRRQQCFCYNRGCFLVRPTCLFATFVLWCDSWPFCSWKLMQRASIARTGRRTRACRRVLQPATVATEAATPSYTQLHLWIRRGTQEATKIVLRPTAASTGGEQGQRWSKTRAAWVWVCVRDPASSGDGASFFLLFFFVREDDERGERTDLTVMPVQIERL